MGEIFDVREETDWLKFAAEFDVVVDPMILRTGDLFLRGPSGVAEVTRASEPGDVWRSLKANVGSLATFVDTLILQEQIPAIDYGITYDINVGEETRRLPDLCNEAADAKIFVSVHVWGEASAHARRAALEELKNSPPVPADLAQNIADEMSAFEHEWRPELGRPFENDQQRLVATFQYGALLFGAFAKKAGASHLLQAKRSRLFLGLGLGADHARMEDEDALFRELLKRSKTNEDGDAFELEWPSFLPYLLAQEPTDASDLLKKAFKLRNSPVVAEHRGWKKQVLQEWEHHGRIKTETVRSVRSALKSVRDELTKKGLLDDLAEAKVVFKGIELPELEAGLKIPIGRLWGWAIDKLPGRRHSKLLHRLFLHEGEYVKVENALRTIWFAT